ncbi:hypothetical protein LGZ99_23485 [Photorhabdus temperata]|uniref:hypothetical protein n=1 Tax=Photorhabdus temperata TaxID=574560 RepID=UPI0021D49C14|nr:hypothetical protein [Photorhabdus temperata]MCT8350077.1 hypothetical protein [Photorhabdus temperata]
MTTLLNIAEAILSSSQKEYRAKNLESIKSVQDFAEGAFDLYISSEDADKILTVCKAIHERIESGEVISENDWHYDFEKPLSE